MLTRNEIDDQLSRRVPDFSIRMAQEERFSPLRDGECQLFAYHSMTRSLDGKPIQGRLWRHLCQLPDLEEADCGEEVVGGRRVCELSQEAEVILHGSREGMVVDPYAWKGNHVVIYRNNWLV